MSGLLAYQPYTVELLRFWVEEAKEKSQDGAWCVSHRWFVNSGDALKAATTPKAASQFEIDLYGEPDAAAVISKQVAEVAWTLAVQLLEVESIEKLERK